MMPRSEEGRVRWPRRVAPRRRAARGRARLRDSLKINVSFFRSHYMLLAKFQIFKKKVLV